MRLATCERDLVLLAHAVAERRNTTVIDGARSDSLQRLMYETGRSHRDGVKLRSKHQVDKTQRLSFAIDLGPYYPDEMPHIPWDLDTPENRARWYHFGGYVLGVGKELGIDLGRKSGAEGRCGGAGGGPGVNSGERDRQ